MYEVNSLDSNIVIHTSSASKLDLNTNVSPKWSPNITRASVVSD